MFWILPWFRPSIQKRADFDRQKRFRAPAPSAHAVHRQPRKSPSHAKEGSRVLVNRAWDGVHIRPARHVRNLSGYF